LLSPPIPQLLKLVQSIEAEEESERKRRMSEEEKMGEDAAQRLVLEMKDEMAAAEMQDEEARIEAVRREDEERRERRDSHIARMTDLGSRQKKIVSDYNRARENARNEEKGEKVARKIMGMELKVLHNEWKELRGEWRKAKFYPVRTAGGVCLDVNLRNVDTYECVVDSLTNVLSFKAIASDPEVPPYLADVAGDVKWKEVAFRCELAFVGSNVMWGDMEVKAERLEGKMRVKVERAKGGKSWVKGTEIYASYKGRGWFS